MEALFSGGAAAQRRQHLLQLLDEVWEHGHQIHHEPETGTIRAGQDQNRTRWAPPGSIVETLRAPQVEPPFVGG